MSSAASSAYYLSGQDESTLICIVQSFAYLASLDESFLFVFASSVSNHRLINPMQTNGQFAASWHIHRHRSRRRQESPGARG